MALQVLPEARWSVSKPVVPRQTLDAVARTTSEQQVTSAADGSPLRIPYGRVTMGAQIATMLSYGGWWIIDAIWGEGEIDGVESSALNGEALPTGTIGTHYLGTSSQTVDSWLELAWSARAVTYADARPGIAYSVYRIPFGSLTTWPDITAILRGLKLYDPRTTLTAYSTNPALALADLLSNATYGLGRAVDWTSVIAAADACDELVGGQARRLIGLVIDSEQDAYQWVDALRAYAGCWVVPGDNGLKLIPDRPASSVASYSHAADTIRRLGPLKKRPVTDAPTVMTVRYTDTTTTPWSERSVTVYAPGVEAGTTPRRESEITMTGIQFAAQATREAIERVNKLTLSDLSFDLDVFDDGLAIEAGDVVDVTHPVGLSAKEVRVAKSSGEAGRYTLSVIEYDPAAYSDTIVTEPSSPDTSLPSPSAPLPVTGLTLTEELFQQQIGTYASRIRATWTAPEYPFIGHYRINVSQGGAIVDTGTAEDQDTTYPTAALKEGSYQVDVITISRTGAPSSAASASITTLGKQINPGDVSSVTGFEAGGEVRLWWDEVADDVWRYEVRYGSAGFARKSGTLIDRTDALRLTTKDVPAGTWEFAVWAVDSIGQYSVNAARVTITVTIDANAFLVDSVSFDSPVVSGLREVKLSRDSTVRRFVPGGGGYELMGEDGSLLLGEDGEVLMSEGASGVPFGAKFPNPLGTYTEPLASYYTGAADFVTEWHDFGLALSGTWFGQLSVTTLAGAPATALEVSDDLVTVDSYPAMAIKRTGRFARLRASCGASEAMAVTIPTATARIQVVPREETGFSTSLSSGPKTITLSGEYAAVQAIVLTPEATTAVSAVYDNVVASPSASSFDVYLFDAAGTQVAGGFSWRWKGV